MSPLNYLSHNPYNLQPSNISKMIKTTQRPKKKQPQMMATTKNLTLLGKNCSQEKIISSKLSKF